VAKMAKPKKEKWPYKHIKPDTVAALRSKTDDLLLKDYLFENKAIKVISKSQKDDSTLTDLKKQVKKHRDADTTLQKKKDELKELRESIDEEISEIVEDKKALEGGYREQKAEHKELIKAIEGILESRKINRPS
jgi:hypothetical protein